MKALLESHLQNENMGSVFKITAVLHNISGISCKAETHWQKTLEIMRILPFHQNEIGFWQQKIAYKCI